MYLLGIAFTLIFLFAINDVSYKANRFPGELSAINNFKGELEMVEFISKTYPDSIIVSNVPQFINFELDQFTIRPTNLSKINNLLIKNNSILFHDNVFSYKPYIKSYQQYKKANDIYQRIKNILYCISFN